MQIQFEYLHPVRTKQTEKTHQHLSWGKRQKNLNTQERNIAASDKLILAEEE